MRVGVLEEKNGNTTVNLFVLDYHALGLLLFLIRSARVSQKYTP